MKVVHFCTKAPVYLGFATVFCKFKGGSCLICFWGRKIQGIQWWCSLCVLCNTKLDMVQALFTIHIPCPYCFVFLSTLVHVDPVLLIIQASFHVIWNSLHP